MNKINQSRKILISGISGEFKSKKLFDEFVESLKKYNFNKDKEVVAYQRQFIDEEEGPSIWVTCDKEEYLSCLNKSKLFNVRELVVKL